MATIPQTRGMILEEVLLYLLRQSGYRTIEKVGSDPTLTTHSAGLAVRGRGGIHQIDAIADFTVCPPFSNSQRLLIEAKYYSKTPGIEVVRNAIGVLKDVNEYWTASDLQVRKTRYHYQYACFSAIDFSSNAEKYAYSHDIYLIPLTKSRFIQPVVALIREVADQAFPKNDKGELQFNLTELRGKFRDSFKRINDLGTSSIRQIYEVDSDNAVDILEAFFNSCRRINGSLIAMLARQFPVFLTINPDLGGDEMANLDFRDYSSVRIFWNENGWYLQEENNGRYLFSFDLPPELFQLYADQGQLTELRALDLKEELLSEIQAIQAFDDQVRIITFKLDHGWLSQLREQAYQRQKQKEEPSNG